MGAYGFDKTVSAKTANEAFRMAVAEDLTRRNEAFYGGIAKKSKFQMVTLLPGETARECEKRCYGDEDLCLEEDWAPAVCVDCGPDPKQPGMRIFFFFGVSAS